jgi:hypothetical protein
MTTSGILNPAGGIRYHLRALRYSPRAWQPFKDAIESWLNEWNPAPARLIIVGPSGGYCTSPRWLSRFEEIICVDPDWIARRIFEGRLRSHARRAALSPQPKVIWHQENHLRFASTREQLDSFSGFLAKHPGTPVLFSNFLGQLPLLLEHGGSRALGALEMWKRNLGPMLQGRPWASFHDRLSGPLMPQFAQPYRSDRRLTNSEILERLYPNPEKTIELVDHEMDGFFPHDQVYTYFHWRLRPRSIHLIEAVFHSGV